MRRLPVLVVLVVMAALAAPAADQQMVGSWTAQFDGTTYVRLDLRSSNGTLTGGISLGSIELDKTGVPVRVGEAPRVLSPIVEVTSTDTTVRPR